MQKIGVIGLGNIAQKAYLPVMATLQDQFEWHLTTRNLEKGQQLQQKYHFSKLHQTLDELIAEHPLAVFVHTPTNTHADIIEQLLRNDINVYVDKPVSDDLDTVKSLYSLAESKNLLLTCGFNRRFAPLAEHLKSLPNKQMINVEKTREDVQQSPKEAIYDLASHVIDTALFLADHPTIDDLDSRIIETDDQLKQYYLSIDTPNMRINASINMKAGLNLEQATVQTDTGKETVTNLNQLTKFNSSQTIQEFPSDWQNTLTTRGFQPLINNFLNAVTDHLPNPVSPDSSILTHYVCAESLKKLQ